MFGRDLLKDLQSEISGDFKDAIEGMMMSPAEFDAFSFKKAMSGLGTDGDFFNINFLLFI